MTNIFKIKKEYLDLIEQVMANDGEFTAEILQKLEINESELKEKAVNYAKYINKLKSDIDIIDLEIKRLNELKAVNKNKIEVLKDIVQNSMKLYKIDKIDSPTLKLSFRKSESVRIIDESIIPHNFLKTIIKTEPDKKSLKQAIKASDEGVLGAEIIVNYNLQIK